MLMVRLGNRTYRFWSDYLAIILKLTVAGFAFALPYLQETYTKLT